MDKDHPANARFSFADIQRGTPLLVLAVVFAIAVVALGRLKGTAGARWHRGERQRAAPEFRS